MRRHTLGDAVRPADDVGAGELQPGVELVEQTITIPSRFGEDTGVLGADDEDHVEAEDELRVVQRAQACGERVREALRIAGELVDDAPRAL
eukprot:gene25229-biopygen18067